MYAFDVLRAPGVEVALAGSGPAIRMRAVGRPLPPTGGRQVGDTDKRPFTRPPSNAYDHAVKVAINEASVMISTSS